MRFYRRSVCHLASVPARLANFSHFVLGAVLPGQYHCTNIVPLVSQQFKYRKFANEMAHHYSILCFGLAKSTSVFTLCCQVPVFVADKWKSASEQKSDTSGKAGDGIEAATGSQGGGERGGVIGRVRMVYDPRSQSAADKGQSAAQVSCYVAA